MTMTRILFSFSLVITGVCGGIAGCGDGGDPAQLDTVASAPESLCATPWAPPFPVIHVGAVLEFLPPDPGVEMEVGTTAGAAIQPDQWILGSSVTLNTLGDVTVFARLIEAEEGCAGAHFAHTYRVAEAYPGDSGDSTAVAMEAPEIAGWASGWVDPVSYGTDVDAKWRTPENALGPATGTSFDTVVLGRGGRIVLTFGAPVTDEPGADFVVFENGFTGFRELGRVAVSSDGEHFTEFPTAYLGTEPVDQYGQHDAALMTGFAGKYRRGFGTPFDLALLAGHPNAANGKLNVAAITHIRVEDIIGDGSQSDSFGNPVYDPYPTIETAGFDLEAIGIIHSL